MWKTKRRETPMTEITTPFAADGEATFSVPTNGSKAGWNLARKGGDERGREAFADAVARDIEEGYDAWLRSVGQTAKAG